MNGINIVTTDKFLANDLKAMNIDGLSIAYRQRVMNTADIKYITDTMLNIVIYFACPVAINIFSSWLYDRIKNDKSNKTIVNNY